MYHGLLASVKIGRDVPRRGYGFGPEMPILENLSKCHVRYLKRRDVNQFDEKLVQIIIQWGLGGLDSQIGVAPMAKALAAGTIGFWVAV